MARKLSTAEYRKLLHDIMINSDKEEWTASDLASPLLEEVDKVQLAQNPRGYYNSDWCSDWAQRVAQVLKDDPFIHREKKNIKIVTRWYRGNKRVYVYSIDKNNIEWWVAKGLGKKLVYYCGCRFVFSTKNPDRWKLINYDLCPIHTR